MPNDPLTPERLEAIRAAVADVERRAGRIAAWKAMPHPFAVESGLRTQGLRAPRLAADVRDLLAEVERLKDAEAERDRLLVSLTLEQGLRHTFEEAAHALQAERDRMEIQVERLKQTLRSEVIRLEADITQLVRERNDARKWSRRWKTAAKRSRRWTNRYARLALCLARRSGSSDADPK